MESKRAAALEYPIRDIMAVADELSRSGKKIIYLNIGDPVQYGFETPLHIKEALKKAVDSGLNYYAPSEGLMELREAIAEKENHINGAQVDPKNVVVTTGISEAIHNLMAAVVNRGDEVLLPGPCYPPYFTYTSFFEGRPITYRTIEEKDWTPDLADIERKINRRTKLLVIVNPNNPCGSVYSKDDIVEILELAASHNIPVATDEIYDRIIFDGSFTSVASVAKDIPLIGLNGFSKSYLMTGWRLGYMYLQDPEDKLGGVWDGVQKLSRIRLCANTPTQVAGVDALRGPQDHIREMVTKLRRRRDFSLKRINEIPGLTAKKPAGAFYVFPRIPSCPQKWKSDEEFVLDVLEQTGVLVVHGSGFDPECGRDHFRAVFLPDEHILGDAFSAIEDFMKRNT